MNVIRLPLDAVNPDPNQPRQFFNKEELANLAMNIAEHGVLEPILVRTNGSDGSYVIIAGERRWRASKIADMVDIPAIVRDDIQPSGRDEVSISENTSRQDLNPIEEARAFSRLRADRGYGLEEIARKIGRSQLFVSGRLTLLDLEPDFQRLIETGHMGPLTGQTIARLPREHQFLAFKAWNEGGIGDNGLRIFVDTILARLAQPELFSEAQAPARKREALAYRERFEKAIDAAMAAISSLTDKRTNTLMITALEGDFQLYKDRLRMIEQECRRLRTEISAAAKTSDLIKAEGASDDL